MSDSPDAPLPALKQGLEAVQIEHEGKPMILLRDQEGITSQAIAVTLPGFLLAMMLNGKNTVADIQSLFAKNTGALLPPEEIKSMVAQLEKSDLLETEALKEKRRKILQDFLADPLRRPVHQGTGYPENTLELAAVLGKFFKDPKGPKKEMASGPVIGRPPLGLVSPHIDFERGGPAYAWAYQALSESSPPDVIIALGVAHMSPNSPWVFTTKKYQTPYGPMPVDEELFGKLKPALWYDPRADEWAHRTEHSLEFQALWLKYLWKDKTPPWVPILCSTFERFSPDKAPSTIPTIEDAIQKMGVLLKTEAAAGKKILILAGIDLAHVGPRFGDEEVLGPALEKKVEEEDKTSLEFAMNLDADGFYNSVVADGHWRKVCGLSATYTALRLLKFLSDGKPLKGRTLTYGQAPDPMGGLVSFTSAIFS